MAFPWARRTASDKRDATMNILIEGTYSEEEREVFDHTFSRHNVTYLDDVTPEGDMGDAQVLIFRSWRTVAPLLSSMKRLEFMQYLFAGVDRLDFSSIPSHITVASCSGSNATPVAEHAFAMLLALSKHIKEHHESLSKGVFSQQSPLAAELAGKRIGIIGYGEIGARIGRYARAFEMEVYAVNSTGTSDADITVTLGGLHGILHDLDFIVLSIPLTVHTRGLIDAKALSMMQDDATLINVSRGEIIVEGDLYEHLVSHPDFSAGLDVWWHYPHKGARWEQAHPFLELPNVLATPHNAAMVEGWRLRTVRYCSENVLRYIEGKEVKNKVRKEDYLM
ncbi:hydroxyacid dehydrogenase [archaeon]|nr:MAG: hydroxyacid dehydrogenase [archaeon]